MIRENSAAAVLYATANFAPVGLFQANKERKSVEASIKIGLFS